MIKQSKLKKVDFRVLLFYIFWTMLLIGKGIGMTSADKPMRILTWIGVSLSILKSLLEKWNKRELIISIMLVFVGLIIFYYSQDAAILLSAIVICGLKGINLHEFYRHSFWIKLSLFFAVTLLAIFGVIDKEIIIRFDNGNIHTIRYALGYGHPNATHYTLFSIFVFLFLSYSFDKLWIYVALEAYNAFIYYYTDSRTGFIMTTFLVFMMYIYRKKLFEIICLKLTDVFSYSYIVFTIISLLIPKLIQFLFGFRKYGTMYSRFLTGLNVIENNRLRLFGQTNIKTDFGYVYIGYAYGIIALVLFVVLNTVLMRMFVSNNHKTEFVVLLSYSIYTLMESYSASVLMNVSLVLIALLIYESTRRIYFAEGSDDSLNEDRE